MAMYDVPATLIEQIDDSKDSDISYRTLHMQAIIRDEESGDSIKVPFHSYLSKYKDFLSGIIIEYELTEESRRKYWYKPKTFSFDMYGITDLWYSILLLNNCFSISEFTPKKTIKYYDPDRLKLYINEIFVLEGVNV